MSYIIDISFISNFDKDQTEQIATMIANRMEEEYELEIISKKITNELRRRENVKQSNVNW